MNATPGPDNEYSRGSGASKRPATPRSAGGSGGSKGPSRGGSGSGSSGSAGGSKRSASGASEQGASGTASGGTKRGSGAAKQPAGAAKQPSGAAKQPARAAKQPSGAAKQSARAAKPPAGAAKESPGTAKRSSSSAKRSSAAGGSSAAGAKRAPRRRPAQNAAPVGWMPADVIRTAALIGALAGALLLIISEFTSLYQVHTAASPLPVKIVGTGSNDTYALIPLGLLAAVLGYAVFRSGSRPALLALGIVGLVALLIALLGDLPDAQATGLVGTPTTQFLNASSTPSAGLYLETLGAVVLIGTSVLGFLMLGTPEPGRRPRDERPAARQPGEASARRRSVS